MFVSLRLGRALTDLAGETGDRCASARVRLRGLSILRQKRGRGDTGGGGHFFVGAQDFAIVAACALASGLTAGMAAKRSSSLWAAAQSPLATRALPSS